MDTQYNTDCICCVLASENTKATIRKVLDAFIPGYIPLNPDYNFKREDPDYKFDNEDEMLDYFLEHYEYAATFYWNKYHDNQHKIMVGADITTDNKLVISITLNGTESTIEEQFTKLKKLLQSDISVIWSGGLPEYKDGADFIARYGKNKSTSQRFLL